MIPPTTSEPGLGGNGTSQTADENNGQATGTLVPYRSNMPAEISQDWGYDTSGWGANDSSGQGINPFDFFYALRRRWVLATGLSIGLALAVMATLYLLVPIHHEATLLLRIHSQAPGDIRGRHRPLSKDDIARMQATEKARAKSTLVLESLLRPPEIQELETIRAEKADPVRFLAEELRVGILQNSEIMYFSLRGKNANDAIKIVDQWYTAYEKEVIDKEKDSDRFSRDRTAKLLRDRSDSLREARQSLRKLFETAGVLTPDDARRQAQVYLSELNLLASTKRDADRNFDLASQELLSAQFKDKAFRQKGPSPEEVEIRLVRDQSYQALQAMASQADQYYQSVLSIGSARGGNPAVQRAQASAAEAQKAVDRYKRNYVQGLIREYKSSGRGRDFLAPLELQVEKWRSQKALISEQYNELLEKMRTQQVSTVDMEAKQDRVNQLVQEIEKEAEQLAEWELKVSQPSRVEKIQSATVPQTPDLLTKRILVLGAGFLTICLTLGSVGGWEFMKKRISTIDDVSKRLKMPLVGTLPVLSGRAAGQIFGGPSQAQLESVLGDSIDSIRTALIHGAGNDGHRVVIITSAWDGEGKSTVASQLAVSLARCGRRTLLVDGDLRSPTLHHLFEMPQEQGLSEVLRGDVEVENAIRPTPAEGLRLLGAGHCDYASIQSLENDSLGELFDRLRSQYDFVIIDSPPVLAFADSLLMGQYADGAVLSVRLDFSQTPKIAEARDRLKAVGIRLFGGVINGVKIATSHRAFGQTFPALTQSDEKTSSSADSE